MNLFDNRPIEEIAIMRIREMYYNQNPYNKPLIVTFSGGKDSICILELTKRANVPYQAEYMQAFDMPSIIKFIKSEYSEVKRNRKTNIFKLIEKHNGFLPMRQSRYCCEELKEMKYPEHVILTGIRWQESNNRSKRRMIEVCKKNKTQIYLHPIIDWKDGDVWNFIKSNNLKYPIEYDNGYKRIGCILCPLTTKDNFLKDERIYPGFVKAIKTAISKGLKKSGYDSTAEINYQKWKDTIIGKKSVLIDDDQCIIDLMTEDM